MRHVVCIGHAKCGTTLLHEVLGSCGTVATPSWEKEIKFFLPANFPPHAALTRYLLLFHLPVEDSSIDATFEASPQYSHQSAPVFEQVLRNIQITLPDPYLVLCFRQPLERAYSHYIHNLHQFALYGDGVFNRRADLMRKGCALDFRQALSRDDRLRPSYSRNLELALRYFGRERVALFFLDHDAQNVEDWARINLGIDGAMPSIGQRVFERRPLPNYTVQEDTLTAFGSGIGERMDYQGVGAAQVARVMRGRDSWTLRVSKDEIEALTREFFAEDLLACSALIGNQEFHAYMRPSGGDLSATMLTDAASSAST